LPAIEPIQTGSSTATTSSDMAQMGSIMPAFFDFNCHANTPVNSAMSIIDATSGNDKRRHQGFNVAGNGS
jgi:hypothetical protein